MSLVRIRFLRLNCCSFSIVASPALIGLGFYILMKIGNIINGWSNLIQSKLLGISSYIEAQSKIRESICDTCPANKKNICDHSVKMIHSITQDAVEGCGCPLSAKVMAQHDECPAGKWFAMVKESTWNHVMAISKYKKLAIANTRGTHSYMYNNNEGMFVSDQGLVYTSYIQMARYHADNKLLTVNLLDAVELFKLNESTNSFIIDDNAIEFIRKLQARETILWMPKYMIPHISMELFIQKCSILVESLFEITRHDIKFIHTTDNDLAPVRKILEIKGVYLDGSFIMQALKEKL